VRIMLIISGHQPSILPQRGLITSTPG